MIPEEMKKKILNKPLNSFDDSYWDDLNERQKDMTDEEFWEDINEYKKLCAIRSKRYEKEKKEKGLK